MHTYATYSDSYGYLGIRVHVGHTTSLQEYGAVFLPAINAIGCLLIVPFHQVIDAVRRLLMIAPSGGGINPHLESEVLSTIERLSDGLFGETEVEVFP